MLAHFIERGFEEIGAVHAGDFDWILKREEQSFARALLGVEIEQILAVVNRFACDVVTLAAGQHGRQSALAAAVRTHDGVDFAGIDDEADALEDLFALNARAEVSDFENRLVGHLKNIFTTDGHG